MKAARWSAFSCFLALSGCADMMVGHEKVEGWPKLEIVEHYVPHQAMRARCARYVPNVLMQADACAEFDLANGRCNIWFSADSPPSQATRDHERLHCEGYDHVGSQSMRSLLERYLEWKAANDSKSGTDHVFPR